MLRRDMTVVVIGGATVDICGFASHDLVRQNSNPGKIKITAGGVGRNVAENLARLGLRSKLITALGDDELGRRTLAECEQAGIDVKHVQLLEGMASSMYVALHDKRGNMALAISQMETIEAINPAFIEQCADDIANAQLLVLDTNLNLETVDYILTEFNHKDIFVDPVSVSKAKRIKHHLSSCHTIKPNRLEAEVLANTKIRSPSDLKDAAEHLLNSGIKQIFISLGEQGVFYGDENASGHLPACEMTVVSDTGAGDAFMAGLVFSHLKGYEIEASARFSMAAANVTLSSAETVNSKISVDLIRKHMPEISP